MQDLLPYPPDARLFLPGKIAAIVALLADEAPASRLLRGSGLTPAELDDPATFTSEQQFLVVCENARQVCDDGALGLRLGAAMRPSMNGLFGYALLCSPTMRDAYEVAQRYRALIAMTMEARVRVDGALVAWEYPGGPARSDLRLSPALSAMMLQMQMANLVRHHVDVMGAECVPLRASLVAAPSAPAAAQYARWLQAPVSFGQRCNEVHYAAAWLDRPTLFANPATAAALRNSCDARLAELQREAGAARQVRQALVARPGHFARLEAIATQLGITPRSLRRRLAAEGTSYQALLNDLRCEQAIDSLQRTTRSLEDIAEALGYSDATSFRHAFRRWTGKAPTEFRRRL